MSEHGLDYSRIAVAAVLLIALTTRASAQTSLSRPRDDQRAVLADYEGEYSYHAAANLLIVASDTMLFAGQTVDATTVVVKYTYDGDANLDGTVNSLDFRL